jgi:hypothetical protein
MRLLIHKQGENQTIQSPEMTPEQCESQRAFIAAQISVAHGGPIDAGDAGNRDRDRVVELGWASIAAHVITGVEIADEESDDAETPPEGKVA